MFMKFISWLFNTGGQKPKYQNVPYQTRTGTVIPQDFKEDQANV